MNNVALFFALCGCAAVASLLTPARWSPRTLAGLGAAAALLLMLASGVILFGDARLRVDLWEVESLGTMKLGADRLSALFLIVCGAVYFPVSLYSAAYLERHAHRLPYFGILYHGLFASIVLILIADDALSFLIAWEAMSILSYLLVTFEYERDESSRAAYVMLAMSEGGFIAVAIAFFQLGAIAGGLDFATMRSAAPLGEYARGAVFLLSFFGFAVKAGLVPVNSWLALAHPVAPTNVSALLSTIIVNLGVYGIIRVNFDLAPIATPGPGLVVLAIGSISALAGILYATIQAEMKRLLAHSTIENMGIVAAGLGAAMVFIASDLRVAASIALLPRFITWSIIPFTKRCYSWVAALSKPAPARAISTSWAGSPVGCHGRAAYSLSAFFRFPLCRRSTALSANG